MKTIVIAKAGTEVQVDWDALPEASKAYVIQYGLTQCLNDAHASVKATEDGAQEKAKALMEVRLEALRAGNPPSVGARAQTRPEWMKVAEDIVSQALRANGIKKKTVDMDALVAKLYETQRGMIDAEVERRKNAKPAFDLAALGL